jgi:hypothetical protein
MEGFLINFILCFGNVARARARATFGIQANGLFRDLFFGRRRGKLYQGQRTVLVGITVSKSRFSFRSFDFGCVFRQSERPAFIGVEFVELYLLLVFLRVAESGSHEGDSDDSRECCVYFHLGLFWFVCCWFVLGEIAEGLTTERTEMEENQGLGVLTQECNFNSQYS